MWRNNVLTNVFLSILALIYYIPFVNKGLILFDEGYMIHFAQRIATGQIPYYDFFVQYTPGFFYLLAFFFKLFGTNVLVGRIVTVSIAYLIVLLTFFLLDELGFHKLYFKIPSLVLISVFGFPLLNVPIDVWPCILLTVALMIVFVRANQFSKKWKYSLYLGLLLSLMIFMKQNLGLGYLALVNLLLFVSWKENFKTKIINLLIIDSIFIVLSAPWIYYFFIRSGDLSEFLRFSHDFVTTHPFSYPPLTYLFQPLGLFKLLPYYMPAIFVLVLCYQYFFKKDRSVLLYTSLFPILGFALTIIPLTDLVHIYPFLGLSLVMFFLGIQKIKLQYKLFYIILLAFTVIIGLYLTLFREQYRYGLPYRVDTTYSNLLTAKGIMVTSIQAKELSYINSYVDAHSKKSDYIFVYPFSPMLYFLTDRQNPTRYGNLIPGNVTYEQEKQIVAILKKKKVSIVLTVGNSNFKNSPIADWVQKHTILIENNSLCQIRKVINY